MNNWDDYWKIILSDEERRDDTECIGIAYAQVKRVLCMFWKLCVNHWVSVQEFQQFETER